MFRRRLHRDPRIAAMLAAWDEKRNFGKNPPAFTAARRLFRTWEDMQAFYQLAFPGSLPIGDHRYIVDAKLFGNMAIDAALVLQTLEDAEVTEHELVPAAFLVADNDCCAIYGKPLIEYAIDYRRAREFLTEFATTPIEDLRTVFAHEPWGNTGVVPWVRACLDRGIPASYVEALIHAPTGRFYLDAWTPDIVAEKYSAGVPAGYLRHFWDRPDWFDEAWHNGLSLEYAIALDSEA